MNRKRVLILANMTKPGASEQAASLRPWLEAQVKVLGVWAIGEQTSNLPDSADLCIVLGGDGTLLAAARLLAGRGVPLLGVNMGKLGFLAEFNIEHMKKHLGDILSGSVKPKPRMMLEVSVIGADGGQFRSPSANDVVIAAGPPFRMIDLSVMHGDAHIARYLGDGLIISTPTGSTGYNLSAGGPVLDPLLDAITITPIAPHSLALRPIVVRSDQAIRVTADKLNSGTAVIVDGQVSSPMEQGNVVEVRRAPYSALIVPHPGRGFYRTLAEKLQWGLSPHHPGPPSGPLSNHDD